MFYVLTDSEICKLPGQNAKLHLDKKQEVEWFSEEKRKGGCAIFNKNKPFFWIKNIFHLYEKYQVIIQYYKKYQLWTVKICNKPQENFCNFTFLEIHKYNILFQMLT